MWLRAARCEIGGVGPFQVMLGMCFLLLSFLQVRHALTTVLFCPHDPSLLSSHLPLCFNPSTLPPSPQVGPVTLEVLGTCPRCDMLQIEQASGKKCKPDILVELAQYRRLGGKMHFGVLLAAAPGGGAPAPGPGPAAAAAGGIGGGGAGGGANRVVVSVGTTVTARHRPAS
jgi:hypothetical protein